jgi:ABC-type molybdenum transport system ATPase subunit/photorepair protein PhrA
MSGEIMTGQPLLQVNGVETYYGNIRALAGIDVEVNKGEIVSLIGANGAGKSTLMGPAPAPARSNMTARTSPMCRHTRSRGCESPSPRKAGGFSRA